MASVNDKVSTRGKVIAWLILAAAGGMAIAGYVFDLWSTVVWYDGMVHAVLSFAVTLVVAVHLYGFVLVGRGMSRTAAVVGVVALVGLGLGGAWEIAERLAELLLFGPGNFQRGDTIADLALDFAGALAAGAFLVVLGDGS